MNSHLYRPLTSPKATKSVQVQLHIEHTKAAPVRLNMHRVPLCLQLLLCSLSKNKKARDEILVASILLCLFVRRKLAQEGGLSTAGPETLLVLISVSVSDQARFYLTTRSLFHLPNMHGGTN